MAKEDLAPLVNHSILIVDDDGMTRAALHRELRHSGFNVIEAGSGSEALRQMAAHDVFLVIADHMMPGMTGLELLRELKAAYPEAIRVMLTAHNDLDVVLSAINEGEVYRFLRKPWDADELRRVVRSAVRTGTLVRRLVATIRDLRAQLRVKEEEADAFDPAISIVRRDETGKIIISDEELRELETELRQLQAL